MYFPCLRTWVTLCASAVKSTAVKNMRMPVVNGYIAKLKAASTFEVVMQTKVDHIF